MVIVSSCIKAPQQEDIYGSWRGEYQGQLLFFRFNRDGTCVLSFTDHDSGSSKTLNGNFSTDFSKIPRPLTIRNIPQLNHPLHTILEFMGNDSIRIAYFAPRLKLRPISFDKNRSIILSRNLSEIHQRK
jgi:hypothetical protein